VYCGAGQRDGQHPGARDLHAFQGASHLRVRGPRIIWTYHVAGQGFIRSCQMIRTADIPNLNVGAGLLKRTVCRHLTLLSWIVLLGRFCRAAAV
jgi:hypothetical protein